MGDLKTNFDKAVYPNTDNLGGDSITQRGTDPLIDTGGAGALQDLWQGEIVPKGEGQESANSVSGLPSLPSRWEPAAETVEPPSLEDRQPGTIDKR